MSSIVIVPPPGLRGIYLDNRTWAQQYVSAGSDRGLVELAASTPEAALAATRVATAQAGTTGQIIYAVGHGGAGASAQGGQVDFAPNRAFRVSQFLAYYEDATGTWRGPSIPEMETEARRVAGLRRRPRGVAERAWCGRYIAQACGIAREQILDLQTLQPHYLELGRIFRAAPVSRIVLLTCNVGNAPDFLNELATDLGVVCTAYTERVLSRWVRAGRSRHVWMFLEGDRPGHGSNNDRADVELMPGVDHAKVITGRMGRRPNLPSRAAGVPPAIER